MRAGRPIDGVLLDMDGVLNVSWKPLPGAIEAVADLRGRGIPFRVMTNTTSHSRATLAGELRSEGFEVADDDVLTAPIATARYLREHHPGARCFLLGLAGDVLDDMAGPEWVEEDADVVVVGGADEAFTFDAINRAFRMLASGASFVAMHRNLSWMTSEGISLDAGAYVLGLEAALGRTAVVTGKPSPEFFGTGLDSLGLSAERVAMVGDDVETDVLAAQALGMTGVLVRTGKVSGDTLGRASGTPDHVIESVAGLPSLL